MIFNDNNVPFEVLDKKFSEIYFRSLESASKYNLNLRQKAFINNFSPSHPLRIRALITANELPFDDTKLLTVVHNLINKIANKNLYITFQDLNKSENKSIANNQIEEIVDWPHRPTEASIWATSKFNLIISEKQIQTTKIGQSDISDQIELISFAYFLNLFTEGLLPLKKYREGIFKKWQSNFSLKLTQFKIENQFSFFSFESNKNELNNLKKALDKKNILFEMDQNKIWIQVPYDEQENCFQNVFDAIS